MDFENMSFEELKEIAKQHGIMVGNIGKAKLIEKIKSQLDTAKNALNEGDDLNSDFEEKVVKEEKATAGSTLNSIINAIDDLEESDDYDAGEKIEDLPIDTVIPVRSITFGSLIYKSRSNNATYIWNEIGAVEHMTIAAITEMNNYNIDYLRKPLVILLDERAIRQFRLTDVYEKVAQINNLKSLFKSDLKTISNIIDDVLNANMRDMLISKVRAMYKKNILTDVRVIKLLEQKLRFDLTSDDNN